MFYNKYHLYSFTYGYMLLYCSMYAFMDRNKKFWYFIVCDQAKTRENQSVIIHLYNNASTSAHGLEHEKNNSTRKHILYLKICTYSCWVIFSCLVRYFFLLTFTWSGPIFVWWDQHLQPKQSSKYVLCMYVNVMVWRNTKGCIPSNTVHN